MSFINNTTIDKVTKLTIKELKENEWMDKAEESIAQYNNSSCKELVEKFVLKSANTYNFKTIQEYVDTAYEYYVDFIQEEIKKKGGIV